MTRYSTCSRCSASTRCSARASYARPRRRHRPRDARRDHPAGRGAHRRIVRRRRPQPPGLRPRDPHRDAARGASRSRCAPSSTAAGTRSASTRSSAACRCPARCSGPSSSTSSAPTPPSTCTSMGAGFAQIFYDQATEEQKKWAVLAAERGWGATMVLTEPDAGSDVGAGRTKAVQQADGTWHIDGVKRFITSGDADDLVREHPPPGAGPPRGRRTRHQGSVAVLRAEVPLRLRDRRARRAQRRLRHQRRAQDGPQGLRDLRAVARSARHPRRRLARRRGAQRHRADVRRHRAGPNDGGHQGHRHAVDRLPQRARVRQDPHPGRRPDPDDRQDRAARDHHAPPRRASLADDAEGLRRGLRALYLYTATFQDAEVAKAVHGVDADLAAQGQRPAAARSSRASARSRPTPS